MKNRRFLQRMLIFILLIMPLFTLAACGDFPFFKSKPPAPTRSAQAEQYMLTRALAGLALEKSEIDKKRIKSYAKDLNARVAKGKAARQELQLPVLVMEYTLRGQSETQAVLVPVALASAAPSFKYLQQAQKNLSGMPHTLRALHAHYVTIIFPPSQKFSDEPSLLRQQLGEERRAILDNATALPSYENARLQLQLAEFFMKARVRDAAYLALENAKDALVLLAEKMSDENIASLSQRAAALESKLHKEMPYKL